MKTDARVRYTKMRIRDAFIQLLKTTPLNKIKITDLCTIAEINRATFYKHYNDQFDLMEKIKQDILEKRCSVLNEAETEKMEAIFIGMAKNMKKFSDVYITLCSQNGDPLFARELSKQNYGAFWYQWEKELTHLTQAQKKMCYSFLAQGGSGVLQCWIDNGMEEPPEEVANMLRKLSTIVVKGIEKINV